MVEFLVTHGANVNRKDNEGWTPLHATSSCGIVSIARYLIENGADLASVNSDGELPIDIAGTNAMADLLQHYIDEQGIDCDEARQQEEKLMLSDAKKWLRSDASEADRPHPKTGATALHVAAAKGYTKVLSLLLAGRADVDRQDNDGWTPLHAACYWGKKEAAQMLIASMADMDILNYSNQTCIEIAPKEMIPWLEELRKNNKRTKRRPVSQIRISDNNIDNNIESPPKVIRVELKSPAEQQTTNECDFENSESDMEDEEEEEDDNEEEEEEESEEESESAEEEQKQTNKMTTAKDQMQLPLTKENDSMDDIKQKQDNPTQVPVKENQTNNDSEVILRRTQSFENDEKFYQKYIELRARIKANSCPALPATQITIAKDDSNKESVTKSSTNFIIQRSASLKDHRSQLSNRKIDEKTPPTSPTTPTTPASTPSGHLRSYEKPTPKQESAVGALVSANQNIIDLIARRYSSSVDKSSDVMSTSNNARNNSITDVSIKMPVKQAMDESQNNLQPEQPTTPQTPTSPSTMLNKLSPGNIFKNIFKSFVPPTRDEESETQRKAHAKRVRETRRSTQGVTLDEIKSAEQLVKMKNASNSNGNTENTNSSELNERLSDTTTIAAETSIMKTDDSSINEEVNVNYTISSPLRKTLRSSVDKEDEENDQKISATFTISPPSSRTNVNSISQLANRLEKGLDLETEVSATINVPLISPTKNNADSCEKLKKTDPPVPQPRSLFDIDNATSIKLADKLQEEAKKCDVNTVSDEPSPLNHLTEPLPPSPIHHTIFGERRPSWRLKTDYNNKFKLEDTSQSSTSTGNSTQQPQTNSTNGIDLSKVTTNTPVVSTRRQNSSENSVPNDTSSAVTKETPVTPNRSDDDKENDKENDSRSGLAIHRRRRPKRRSTGVVHVDMEEIDPEYRQESPVEDNNKDTVSRLFINKTLEIKIIETSSSVILEHIRQGF
ncbi:hypothetical protein PVAND_008792 [Polypedilum vanderplanki]|uniref:Uncharacterized protein n=1 Tax=Polypedilum vanderplanki TaxID=319348 RepID=A0A9J6CBC4_POLVA|nr:hypothetical protein PVAND_008792 [Polypedilum vanderplanki]